MAIKRGANGKFYVSIYRDGQRYNQTFEGTEAEARAFEQELRGKSAITNSARLAELLPGYLLWYETNRSKAALTSVQSAFKHILPVIGSVPICILGQSHYEQYKQRRLQDGAKRASINLELKILVALLNWHAKRGMIDKPRVMPDFFQKNQLQAEIKPIQVLSPAELAKVFATATGGLKTLIMLFYWGGLRRNEAVNLKWSEVDLQAKVMIIRGKGGAIRLQHLPDPLRDYLDGLERNEYVAVTRLGGKFNNPMKQVINLGKRAGLSRPLFPHLFRHTFATALLLQGASLPEVQEALRHTTMQMSRRYVHIAGALSSQSGIRLTHYVESHNEKAAFPQQDQPLTA